MGARGKAREEERLSRVFHCLADPARRKIIALLRESGELPVGAIGHAFAMTQNGVSKHVKVLEAAGVVRRRIEGRVHRISVDWSAPRPPTSSSMRIATSGAHDSMRWWTTRGARTVRESESVMNDATSKVLVERLVQAPPRVVFEAWLDPKALRRFMCGGRRARALPTPNAMPPWTASF